MVTTSAIRGGRIEKERIPAKLEVNVIYTGCGSTLTALRQAARLASSLHARIRILLPSIVPYPLPLLEPPVCEDHLRRILTTVASAVPIETVAQIVYCRDCTDVHRAMRPESLVVIGNPTRPWWPFGKLCALERVLSRAGHHVISVSAKEGRHA
jgi:hypothetical protein